MDNEFEVEYYVKPDGDVPIINFLDSLDNKQVAKMLREIQLLEKNGNELREPHSKALRNGILELRVNCNGNYLRIFYFFTSNRKIILTHGFIKKTQKTPISIINKAIEYRKNYFKYHK